MKKKILFLALSFAFMQIFSQPSNIDQVYQEGLDLYSDGSFDRALTTWLGIADSGYTSPDLFYNIGNAAFKTGNIPVSILYYERALLSKPFDEDIRYNLEIAKSYAIDKFNSIPEFFLVRWFRMVSLMFPSNLWALWSLTTFAITLALLLLYLFSKSHGIKKLSFIISVVALVISISTLL
ncbi:MAG: tetratricopeptide repeat protein, partial [Bacteroidales bacterium]